MATTIIASSFCAGKFSNYLIGGNICNAFALGELGSTDDFFLVGAEPEPESNYPLLTGNILDSDGELLFRLVRNVLVINPGKCSKIQSDHVGYEIHDANDNLIMKVETKFRSLPGNSDENFVTTLEANFYNKAKQLVFKANSGSDEKIESSVKCAIGFSGGFGLVSGLSSSEREIARIMLSSRGAVNRVITGKISDQKISFDGALITKAEIEKCEIDVSTGDFILHGPENIISESSFNFVGAAKNLQQLFIAVQKSGSKS